MTPPALPVVRVPLVADRERSPLWVVTRSSKAATPAPAVLVSVPLRLPPEPFARPTVTDPLKDGVHVGVGVQAHRPPGREVGPRDDAAGRRLDEKSPVAFAAVTSIAGLVPVIVLVTESVAVIVWLPAVSRAMTVKVCDPASAAVKV